MHRSYTQMPPGKAQASPPQGRWFITSQPCSRTDVHWDLLGTGHWRRPWGCSWERGSQGPSPERIHWDRNRPPELWDKLDRPAVDVSPRDAHQPLSRDFFISHSRLGVHLSMLQRSVVISPGRLSEWYIFWAHVSPILPHFPSVDHRAVIKLLESQPIHF